MSKENMRRLNIVEKKNNGSPNSMRNKEKHSSTQSLLSKHLKKVYPVGIHKTSSLLSISSLSLTLSNNSSSGSFTDSSSTLEQTISSALQLIAPTPTPSPTPSRREVPLAKTSVQGPVLQPSLDPSNCEDGLRRCNWITKSSGKYIYVVCIYLTCLFASSIDYDNTPMCSYDHTLQQINLTLHTS